MNRIVVAGASLAGTRAAQRLRSDGFLGELVLLGEETDGPYDRPPLSKQILTGDWAREEIELLDPRELKQLDVSMRLGTRAESLSPSEHELKLSDGSTLGYDGLIITTGARARSLSGLPDSERVHLLRTSTDAARLTAALGPGVRLGVLGGGFLGSEVASSALARGAKVTILEREALPMSAALGTPIGRHIAEVQQARGVDLRTDSLVARVIGAASHIGVELTDGMTLEFDHLLVSIGAIPNVEWLEGSGLEVDQGLITDPKLFVAPDVVAAGDIVRIRDADDVLSRRVEHWTNAAAQGEAAACNLLLGRSAATEFRSVPYVWSDQFGSRIEVLGSPGDAERTVEIWSSADRRALLYACYVGTEVEALVGINATRWLIGVRRTLQGTTKLDRSAVTDLISAVRRAS